MINKVYKLVSPKCIEMVFQEIDTNKDGVIVRPTKLSICAADQRYYLGKRKSDVMKEKLPMALIHEGVGEVVYDLKGEYEPGDKVVMIPNTPIEKDDIICENYLKSSKFRSSGYDGFTQEYVIMNRDRIVKYKNINDNVASFIELISVAMHAINRFEKKSHSKKHVIGVWGDGNLGFIISMILRIKYKKSKIIVFGKHKEKLNYFSFVDEIYEIDQIPDDLTINHGFEAVGGQGSQSCLEQIINHIDSEGTIMLLGVSEQLTEINTRMILEKGLLLIGNSRSERKDFLESVNLLQENEECQNQFEKLISKIIEVNSIEQLCEGFEYDQTTPFKTVLKWNL